MERKQHDLHCVLFSANASLLLVAKKRRQVSQFNLALMSYYKHGICGFIVVFSHF